MKSTQPTATTTAAIIVNADAGDRLHPVQAIVRTDGATTVYLGGSDVTSSNGFALPQDTAVTVELVAGDDLYAVTAAGTSAMSVLKTGG